MQATIPISEASQRTLAQLAEETGQSATDLVDQAIEAYRRRVFFEKLNVGYAELRADPAAWAEEKEERRLWDATLMDGLDPTERWSENGSVEEQGGAQGKNP